MMVATRSSGRGDTEVSTPEVAPPNVTPDAIPLPITEPTTESSPTEETPMDTSDGSTTALTAPTTAPTTVDTPPPRTVPAGKVYGINGLDTPITMEQLQQDNEVMRNQIAVCLEFKRMIENMFMKDRVLLQTGALRPYLEHTKNTLKKYRMIRRAFDNRLEGNIENLDQEGMSKCGQPDCTIPGCYEGTSGGAHGPKEGEENQTAQNLISQNPTIQNNQQNLSKGAELTRMSTTPNKPSVSKKPFSFYPSSSSSILIKPDPDGPSASSTSTSFSTTAHARSQQNLQQQQQNPRQIKPEYNSDEESSPMDVSQLLASQHNPKNPQLSRSVSGPRVSGPSSGVAAPRLSAPGPRILGSSTPGGVAAPRAPLPSTPSSTSTSGTTSKVPASSLQKKDILVNVNGVPKIRCRVEDCDQLMDNEKDVVAHMVNHQKLFKCSLCEALFSEKRKVFRHFVIHQKKDDPNKKQQ